MNLMEIVGRIRRCESELAALAVLEFVLIEARSDERAAIVALAQQQGWAMKDETPFEVEVKWICDVRSREVAALGGKRRAILAPDESHGLTETKMRTLDEHKINPGNDTLTITVLDEPGHGGANHAYDIEGGAAVPTHLRFQDGPITADGNGVNGITHEALLAVLCDRLRGFQKGPYACKANACALTHLEEAQHWLQQRTIERMRRGVEGTHTV